MNTAHISSTVPGWVRDFLAEKAVSEKRTFSQVVALYLEKIVLQEQAVKPKK